MVENSNPGADSKQGESTSEKEKEEEGDIGVLEKGGSTPPYIGQGGCHPPPLPHVGLNSQGEGGAPAIGGMGPTLGAKPKGGTPSSLNGPHGPI